MRAKGFWIVLICFVTCTRILAETPQTTDPNQPVWDGLYRRVHVPVLMYHYVSDIPQNADATRRNLTITPLEFQAQMSYLSAQSYTTISLYQLYDTLMRGDSLPAKPIVLTFDDGYLDDYLNVFPVLRQYGFTATFFIITGIVDASNPGYLSWGDIQAMSNAGMNMEAHTVTHASLRGQTQSFDVNQVQGSIQDLATHTGETPRIFAYPDGQYDTTAMKALQSSGIWIAVTTRGSAWETSNHPLEVPRLRIDHGMGALGLDQLLTHR